jgi:hypothetical protein
VDETQIIAGVVVAGTGLAVWIVKFLANAITRAIDELVTDRQQFKAFEVEERKAHEHFIKNLESLNRAMKQQTMLLTKLTELRT